MEKVFIVLDGHDGSGKTTLAGLLAKTLGGVHLRPFGGNVGNRIVSLAAKGDFRPASMLAKRAADRALTSTDTSVLVLDRHWMTVFTLIPEEFWTDWLPPPPTTLCWAPLDITIERLRHRREKLCDKEYHRRYLRIYEELGTQFNCHLLRTDLASIEMSINLLRDWAWPHVARLTPEHLLRHATASKRER